MSYLLIAIVGDRGDGVDPGRQPDKIKKEIEVELEVHKPKKTIEEEYSIDLEEKPKLSYVG